jgi:hypothetical protein
VPLPGSTAEEEGETYRLHLNAVSDDFFRAMGIPILRGRPLLAHERADGPTPAVVSAAMAGFIAPAGDPLGRAFSLGGSDSALIVGVAADAVSQELGEEPVRQAYLPLATTWDPFVTFVVHTRDDALSLTPAVRSVLRTLDPQMVVGSIATMDGVVSEQVARYRVSAVLVGAFGLVALALAAAGLYGVMAFLVARRTRDIGVRMALGAGRSAVVWDVVAIALRLVLAGIGVGLLGALWLRRFTEGLLYGVSPADPLPLMLAALTLLGVAAAATWVPARRATRVDPLVAMRAE